MIKYLILLAVAFLVFKAFFLDDYLAQRKASEANVTEVEKSVPEQAAPAVSDKERGIKIQSVYSGEQSIREQNISAGKSKPSYSEMPLEKVGDTIAEKLESKIRVDENGK